MPASASRPPLAEPAPAAGAAAGGRPGKKVCTVDRRAPRRAVRAGRHRRAASSSSTTAPTSTAASGSSSSTPSARSPKRVAYSGNGPRDTEDLAVSPGRQDAVDRRHRRQPDEHRSPRNRRRCGRCRSDGAKEPVLHRLAYPRRQAHDAEALLINGDGMPIIVTKEVGKPAELYMPAAALKNGQHRAGVPLKKVGEVTLSRDRDQRQPALGGSAGSTVDRRRPVAPTAPRSCCGRTPTRSSGTSPAATSSAALTGGTAPRVTPLADGRSARRSPTARTASSSYTVSDSRAARRRPGRSRSSATRRRSRWSRRTAVGRGGCAAAAPWTDRISAAATSRTWSRRSGCIGVLLVGAGIFGIMRSRKRKATGGPLGPRRRSARTSRRGSGARPRGRTTVSGRTARPDDLYGGAGRQPGARLGRPGVRRRGRRGRGAARWRSATAAAATAVVAATAMTATAGPVAVVVAAAVGPAPGGNVYGGGGRPRAAPTAAVVTRRRATTVLRAARLRRERPGPAAAGPDGYGRPSGG